MAPREANHTFADHLICMEYDGIGLLPNDPAPPQVLNNNATTANNDEDDVAAAAVVAQQVLEQMRPSESTEEQALVVDPLSIDPTTDEDVESPPRPRLLHGVSMEQAEPQPWSDSATTLAMPLYQEEGPPPLVRRMVSHNSVTSSHSQGFLGLDITHDMGSEDELDEARRPSGVMRSTTEASVSSPVPSFRGTPEPPLFQFGPNTTLADLKYFAERGCIVALLQALHTPKLTAQGARLLADYAKNPARRVAVANNRRILEFTLQTMQGQIAQTYVPYNHTEEERTCRERAVEYAVETIRSLTATEESDAPLMQTPGLLVGLAMMARGGPIGVPTNSRSSATSPRRVSDLAAALRPISQSSSSSGGGSPVSIMSQHVARSDSPPLTKPITSDWPVMNSKTRLHACIAIMNLSCGKSNKIQIAQLPLVLQSMRHVMMDASSATNSSGWQALTTSANAAQHLQESRLKATTCIKNLSNADANDANLLHTPGLVEALGHVILVSLEQLHALEEDEATTKRATLTVTNACLALMNLSIAKANKHRVFQSPGVMDALMAVISTDAAGSEARVKSCSALSNLAIGYDNKIPMFYYKGFVESILQVIETDSGEARTKACSILWSFAAEMRNQVPVVQRGDILPMLVKVAEEDSSTEARFKCVAALTLLAESLENAVPILESGALHPLMDILSEAGPDPTQWQGQTASWCVGFLMNIAQSDDAVPSLRNAGVVELLAPLLTLDHYQSLKAAMAVTFVCRYDEDDSTYDLLRKTETVIPKIISLLHNTLAGKGGNGYKYGVFTLRSSVGCIASLASGPVFMKERMATGPVYESLLRVLSDFCVDCTPGAIVGGGREDTISATLAVQALRDLTLYLIPAPGTPFPFGPLMEERLITALSALERNSHPHLSPATKQWAMDTRMLLMGIPKHNDAEEELLLNMAMAPANFCCDLNRLCSPSPVQPFVHPHMPQDEEDVAPTPNNTTQPTPWIVASSEPVRTFLLSDATGRRFAVPIEPSGGRRFNDTRLWCYRRGRFCLDGEMPDPNFIWTQELEHAYKAALEKQAAQREREKKQSRSRSLFC